MLGALSERRRLRIAIVGSRGIPAHYGGFETVTEEISAGLSREGFQVYVTCESVWGEKGRKAERYATHGGARLVYFPVVDSIRNFSEVAIHDTLAMLWAAFSVDIIYMLAYTSAPVLILPKVLGKKIIVNADGLEWKRPKYNAFLRFLLRAFEGMSARIADYTVVDSETLGAYYAREYGVHAVYIPNGVSAIEPLDPAALRKYGIKSGDYYLVIARLVPDNNIDLIIAGFTRSSSRKKLVVVGPLDRGRYVGRLLAERSERVLFLGGIYESHMQRTLRHNCFAYIHGHAMGGTNPSLVEALSCGNTVLALDIPFNREVAEEFAIYFQKDPDDLKAKIDLVERGLTGIRKEDVYRLYERKYTAEAAIRKLVKLVVEIAEKRARGKEHSVACGIPGQQRDPQII
jgi:rhamnosyltransferase